MEVSEKYLKNLKKAIEGHYKGIPISLATITIEAIVEGAASRYLVLTTKEDKLQLKDAYDSIKRILDSTRLYAATKLHIVRDFEEFEEGWQSEFRFTWRSRLVDIDSKNMKDALKEENISSYLFKTILLSYQNINISKLDRKYFALRSIEPTFYGPFDSSIGHEKLVNAIEPIENSLMRKIEHHKFGWFLGFDTYSDAVVVRYNKNLIATLFANELQLKPLDDRIPDSWILEKKTEPEKINALFSGIEEVISK